MVKLPAALAGQLIEARNGCAGARNAFASMAVSLPDDARAEMLAKCEELKAIEVAIARALGTETR